jgi:hypothetical protein
MTIWFDVEDLINFFQTASRPTGIQRLSFEIYRAAWALGGTTEGLKFCRRGAGRGSYRVIHFPALEAGIIAASHSAPRPVAEPLGRVHPPSCTAWPAGYRCITGCRSAACTAPPARCSAPPVI